MNGVTWPLLRTKLSPTTPCFQTLITPPLNRSPVDVLTHPWNATLRVLGLRGCHHVANTAPDLVLRMHGQVPWRSLTIPSPFLGMRGITPLLVEFAEA